MTLDVYLILDAIHVVTPDCTDSTGRVDNPAIDDPRLHGFFLEYLIK